LILLGKWLVLAPKAAQNVERQNENALEMIHPVTAARNWADNANIQAQARLDMGSAFRYPIPLPA
jgi:hypothetical protein